MDQHLEGARQREQDRQSSLEHDGDHGGARPRMHARDAAQEHAVLRHREVHARGGKDALAEEPER